MKKQLHTYITERIEGGFSVHRYGDPVVTFYDQDNARRFMENDTAHRDALDHHISSTLGAAIVHVHSHHADDDSHKASWHVEVTIYE